MVIAVDNVENTASSTTHTLRVDDTLPQFQTGPASPSGGVWINTSTPTFRWTRATAAESGTASQVIGLDPGAALPSRWKRRYRRCLLALQRVPRRVERAARKARIAALSTRGGSDDESCSYR
jgi:uncharacterized membrane protein